VAGAAAVLWDDVAVHGHSGVLWAANPDLAKFFRAYRTPVAQQPVLEWCKGSRAGLCESDALKQVAASHL
jgi:hypothetical protein